MQQVKFDCDCDKVIEMEEIAPGVEEVLQYARALFRTEEIEALVRGLQAIALARAEAEEACSVCDP